MQDDWRYRVALTLVPGIGPVQARILLQHAEPEEIFRARNQFLEKIEGIGPARARAIRKFNEFSRAEEELLFIGKHGIKALFLTDPGYPKRLLNCFDPPTLLYYKGEADLNAPRVIAVIGTRHNTDYGKQVTEQLIGDLAAKQVTVISGLAFGVDAIAHRSAIRNHIPTIGVLAHGLDQVYPAPHTGLAREMMQQGGGLLTEFPSGTQPDKHNFPSRNRVVAGMCDAVVVIETNQKGGSMITADLANGYNRDVFAIPGKIRDPQSAGCNFLIRTNRAQLLTHAGELAESMGWDEKKTGTANHRIQRELFIDLSKEEKKIVDLLQQKESVSIDEINILCDMPASVAAAAILNLELHNVIVSLPGKIYRLS